MSIDPQIRDTIRNNPNRYPGAIWWHAYHNVFTENYDVSIWDANKNTVKIVASCPTEEAARAALRLMKMK